MSLVLQQAGMQPPADSPLPLNSRGLWVPHHHCLTCNVTFDMPIEECLLRCRRCKLSYYCNRVCQKAHWPIHKKICGTNPEHIDLEVGPNIMHYNLVHEALQQVRSQ